MRRGLLLLSTAISALTASSAFAADLPVKAAPFAPAPVATWTGFYIGANLGYGWANGSVAGVGSETLSGVIGGGQLGYNWQVGNVVFGIEGDFQGSGQKRSDSFTTAFGTVTIDQKIPWFATLRGRLGYAAGPWLIYATGGAAWNNYEASATLAGATVSDSTTKSAWTVGGGVEWMFLPQWSAKLEYLYIDTGDLAVVAAGTTFTARAKDNIVRAGVNYHF
jgi:outer membrane immunogenic protein